jgi:hypothetical protein
MNSKLPIAFLIGSCLMFSEGASAQLAIGPIPYQQNVNGVTVTVTATSIVTVQTNPGSLLVTAKINGDLFDLQQKIGAIVDTFKLPTDNCAQNGVGKINPVVTISSKSLAAQGSQAIFAVGGHVDAWTCVAAKPNIEVKWEMRKIGPIKTKVPVKVQTWAGYIKNKDATQPFDATIPVSLNKQSSSTVALQLGQPNIKLGGQYASLTRGILSIAGVNINQKAADALQSAIDPNKLKATIPTELQKLNMAIQSAQFINDGGHLVAELVLTANVSGADITGLLKEIQIPPAQ